MADVGFSAALGANHVDAIHVLLRGMAPEVGFEPTTNRLTADRSTTELLRIRFKLPQRFSTRNGNLVTIHQFLRAQPAEPTIRPGGLTADRSTTELLRITDGRST
jgi:hypothetical protein